MKESLKSGIPGMRNSWSRESSESPIPGSRNSCASRCSRNDSRQDLLPHSRFFFYFFPQLLLGIPDPGVQTAPSFSRLPIPEFPLQFPGEAPRLPDPLVSQLRGGKPGEGSFSRQTRAFPQIGHPRGKSGNSQEFPARLRLSPQFPASRGGFLWEKDLPGSSGEETAPGAAGGRRCAGKTWEFRQEFCQEFRESQQLQRQSQTQGPAGDSQGEKQRECREFPESQCQQSPEFQRWEFPEFRCAPEEAGIPGAERGGAPGPAAPAGLRLLPEREKIPENPGELREKLGRLQSRRCQESSGKGSGKIGIEGGEGRRGRGEGKPGMWE